MAWVWTSLKVTIRSHIWNLSNFLHSLFRFSNDNLVEKSGLLKLVINIIWKNWAFLI